MTYNPKYTSVTAIQTKTGLTSNEIDLTANDYQLIQEAEAELELITGRKFLVNQDVFTVSGTLDPDMTGNYIGVSNGYISYYQKITDSTCKITQIAPTSWLITQDGTAKNFYKNTGATPVGTYTPAGGATGTATVTLSTTQTSLSVTEYLSGGKKDIFDNKTTAIELSNYPVLTITELKTLNIDGTTNKTYATLSSGYETTDYWCETMEDPLTNQQIMYGRIKLKTDVFPVGTRNIKVSYTYGYATAPVQVQQLACAIAGIRAWVKFAGGSYNFINSYSIPQQTINKGDLYARVKQNIETLQAEANQLLDRIGRKTRTTFFASGQDR
jgi:hypothetical protein